MASSEAVENLINSLAFQVEAVPQDDVLEISETSKATPLNLKIRVRKKEQAPFKQGVVSVPKLGHPKKPPEKIRLVSSDQTVLSFKVFVDTEPGKKSIKKRKSFFGGCLSSEDNDDDAYVLSNLSTATKSGDIVKLNFGVSKTENIDDMPLQPRKPIMFFGNKCKPGGCLDPPFGEDKYSYKPKRESHKTSVQDYSKAKKPKQDVTGILNENVGKIYSENVTKNDEIKTDTTSIQNILPPTKADSVRSSVDTKFSDSIITYPPNEPAEEITGKQSSPKRVSDESSRKSFQEFRDSYYSPPKSVTNSRNNSDVEKGEQKENATNFADRRPSNNKGRITKLYPEENIKQDLKPFGVDSEAILTSEKDDQKSQSVTGAINEDMLFKKDEEKRQLNTNEEALQDSLNSANDDKLQSEKERNVVNDILKVTGAVTAPLLITEVAKQIAKSDKDNNRKQSENLNKNDNDTNSKISSSIHSNQDGVLNSPSPKPDEITESLEIGKDKKESINKTDISSNEENYTKPSNETSGKAKGDSLSAIETNPDTQGYEKEGKEKDLPENVQSPDQSLGEHTTDEAHSKTDDDKHQEHFKDRIIDSFHTDKEDSINAQENKITEDKPIIHVDDKNQEMNYKESIEKELDRANEDNMKISENKEFQQNQRQDSLDLKGHQQVNKDSLNDGNIQSDFEHANNARKSSSLEERDENNRDAVKTNQTNQNDTRDNRNIIDQQDTKNPNLDQQQTSNCDANDSELSQKQDIDKNQTADSTRQQPILSQQYLDGNIKEEKSRPSFENIHDIDNIKQTGTNKQHKSITKPSTNFSKSTISQHCDFVNIDLAFHSYKNDQNESVIKSLDVTKDFKRRSQDNLTIIKSILQLNTPNVIKVPIDNHKYLILEVKCSDHQKPSSSPTLEADNQGYDNNDHSAEGPSEQSQAELETFQNLLTSVYEHQLLPLQTLISDLKKDVEMLATQQLWLKDNWVRSKRTKTVRPTHSSRKCVCFRKST